MGQSIETVGGTASDLGVTVIVREAGVEFPATSVAVTVTVYVVEDATGGVS